ncbi:MAG: NAD(P)-binding protein [Planctomycetota bacterium]
MALTGELRTIAVIGAGPAGAAAACLLARRGFGVTVFESKAFPRVKVCGEYVSPAGEAALLEVAPREVLIGAGAKRVQAFAIEMGGDSVEWLSPRAGWALSRASLDDLLLDRAREAGAEVRQPCSVRSIDWRDDGAVVRTDEGDEAFDLVVHADGSGRFDPAGRSGLATGVVGHKCHLRVAGGVEGVRMRAGNGAYVGLIQVEGGLATCALVAKSQRIRAAGGDADAMLAALWPGYEPSWRTSAWLSCGVGRSRYLDPGHVRSVRLGNAAAAVDPVGGEGIGLALWSAGEWARRMPDRADDLAAAKRAFGRRYRARVRLRRPACRFGAEVLMRPGLVRAMWPLLSRRVGRGVTVRPWAALTGKG